MSSAENRVIAEQRMLIERMERAIRQRSIFGATWTYIAVSAISAMGTVLILAALPLGR